MAEGNARLFPPLVLGAVCVDWELAVIQASSCIERESRGVGCRTIARFRYSVVANRKRRWALLVVGAALLLGLIPLFSYWDIPISVAESGSAAQAYRQAGLPWVAKDLAPVPPVADLDNAAPLLRKAVLRIPRGAEDVLRKRDLNNASDLIPAKKALLSYDSALELAHEAALRPRLDFRRDWAMGPALVIPEPRGLRMIVRALDARAEISALSGRWCGSGFRSSRRNENRLARRFGAISILLGLRGSVGGDHS